MDASLPKIELRYVALFVTQAKQEQGAGLYPQPTNAGASECAIEAKIDQCEEQCASFDRAKCRVAAHCLVETVPEYSTVASHNLLPTEGS